MKPLVLGGIAFPAVWNSSGARNFFGEGYRAHRLWGPLQPRFSGAGFVAKTTTIEPRAGHMPLNGTEPRELKPDCIRINFRKAAVLNAVGLSGPGLEALLADGRWQARPEPFCLSFMAVHADPEGRLEEAREFGRQLARARGQFRAPFGVEMNFSCPNVGLDHADLITEAKRALFEVGTRLPGVPLIPKFSALVPVAAAWEIAADRNCAAISVSNTIPWGARPDRIDWKDLFGETSPLAHLGGGGLSGSPIFPLIQEWLIEAMRSCFPTPIIGGGGVMSWEDGAVLCSHKAAAIEVGSAAIVRPWRVARIIRELSQV
jgi:dihydroorotate dehydrogenase (NAD+) catalytic subunit